MKRFDYEVALNQLDVGKQQTLNNEIKYDLIPSWVQGKDFLNLFLPYVKIIGDSREQDKWIQQACRGYGIAFEWSKKDKKGNTENLKEGDYTFKVVFGNKEYSYVGKVAYERKGRVSEFYNNCTGYNKKNQTSDRDRIKREFERFNHKGYDKVVLMLEFGEKLTDLIDMRFEYPSKGRLEEKNTFYTMYSAVMSWKQPNNKGFEVLQSNSRRRLFWLFLQDCYYYFRNEIRKECEEKNLIQGGEND
jgi:hypothetical protein